MGDLLYSLPLAPGQKKQLVIYDWNRGKEASRAESTDVSEQLEPQPLAGPGPPIDEQSSPAR